MSVYAILKKEDLAKKDVEYYYRVLKAITKRIICFLTVSSLFIGMAGFFKTFLAFLFLGIEPCLPACLVVFLMTFSVYSLNKLTDLKEDAVNMPERLRFLAGRKGLVFSYSLAAYLLSVVIAFLDMPKAVPIVLLPLAANLIYSSKLLPGIPRLKDVPVMKNLFVGLTWALCTTLLPALHGANSEAMIIFVFYFILIKSFINTVLYDIRDEEGDRESGVRTIPVLLGTKKTVVILLALNSTLLPCLFFLERTMLPVALAMMLYGYAYILHFKIRRDPLVLDFFVDGEWMHVYILLLALAGSGFLA